VDRHRATGKVGEDENAKGGRVAFEGSRLPTFAAKPADLKSNVPLQAFLGRGDAFQCAGIVRQFAGDETEANRLLLRLPDSHSLRVS
jgi:hypothetical protein